LHRNKKIRVLEGFEKRRFLKFGRARETQEAVAEAASSM